LICTVVDSRIFQSPISLTGSGIYLVIIVFATELYFFENYSENFGPAKVLVIA
jgi:hypothetical protein